MDRTRSEEKNHHKPQWPRTNRITLSPNSVFYIRFMLFLGFDFRKPGTQHDPKPEQEEDEADEKDDENNVHGAGPQRYQISGFCLRPGALVAPGSFTKEG